MVQKLKYDYKFNLFDLNIQLLIFHSQITFCEGISFDENTIILVDPSS